MEKEKQALRDLLLALRNLPQSYTFGDIPSKIEPNFRQEIDRILQSLATPPLEEK